MGGKAMKFLGRFGRVAFLVGIIGALFCLFAPGVFAASGDAAGGIADFGPGMAYLGAALSTGIAAIGGGIAVGAGAPAAIGALTEDPKSFGKALIFVAMGEGIALYGMLIAILILNKV
jgi:V/A-type H+-transporting ATPase subunit K